MKKIAKRFVAAGLMVMMALGCLTGCNQGAGDQSTTKVFTYDGTDVYLDEAWLYAKAAQAETEYIYAMYGLDMSQYWNMEAEQDEAGNPITYEDVAKEEVISRIKMVKVLVKKAEELGAALTAEDKEEIDIALESFLTKNEGKELLKEVGGTEELVRRWYEENYLATRVQEIMIKDVDTNVSDDEARMTKIEKIVYTLTKTDDEGNSVDMTEDEKKAQYDAAVAAFEKVKNGETTMEALSDELSQGNTFTETYAAGESVGGEAFEEAIAALTDGDLANEVLETEEGYVIARLVAYTDEEATAEKKEEIIGEREKELFQKTYDEWVKDLEAEWNAEEDINWEAWDRVKFAEEAEAGEEESTEAQLTLQTDTTLTVENGDTVNIDYVGSVDGVEFDGGNTNGVGTDLVIGSGTYIDDFEEQLIGAHPGDEVDVIVTFPEVYENSPDLAGKEALFKVVVNGIYR